jgi:hypothetical protein
LAAGFDTVIVIVAEPPAGMEVGANDFTTVGAANTERVALDAAPVPALPLVIGPVVLVYAPGAAAVTFTVTVHEESAGIVAAASEALVAPAPAVTVPEHPAPLIAPAGVPVFARPAG